MREGNGETATRHLRSLRAAWPAIARLAAHRDGVLHRREFTPLLVSPQSIQRAIDGGLLHRIHDDVVALSLPLTERGRMRAAVLAVGDDTALAGRSGPALLGLMRWDGDVHVVAPTKRRDRPGVRVRRAFLDPADLTHRHGLPVLTVPRLLVDCAAIGEPPEVIAAIAREAEIRGLLRPDALRATLDRCRGGRGVGVVRAVLGDRIADQAALRRWLEEEGRRFLKRHGFPPAQHNVLFELPDGTLVERDCHWPEFELVLEWDGRVHAATDHFHEDRREDWLLRSRLGITTVRATTAHLRDHPDELAEALRALMRPRGERRFREPT